MQTLKGEKGGCWRERQESDDLKMCKRYELDPHGNRCPLKALTHQGDMIRCKVFRRSFWLPWRKDPKGAKPRLGGQLGCC